MEKSKSSREKNETGADTKQHRLTLTVSDANLARLDAVYKLYGISKTAQVQSLIAKYLAKEYDLPLDIFGGSQTELFLTKKGER
jgi:hypothetical protein